MNSTNACGSTGSAPQTRVRPGELTGKAALLTGAGGGIGSAVARMLAENGVKVALMGRNPEKLRKTAGAVAAAGGESIVLPGALPDSEYIERAVRKTAEAFGRLDILINNAGVAQSQPFETVSEELFDQIMNANIKGPFLLCQAALPHLLDSGFGTIVNICSVVAHAGYPLQSVYAASKHALLGFTKVLANELYQKNVRVHAISPGGVYTDMVRVARPDLKSDGLILPEDIADAVLFFLRQRSTDAVTDEIQVHRVGKPPFQV